MAKQVKLIARPRTESGRNSVKTVRARGAVPAVIYGARTTPSNLEVTRRDIEVILSHSVGENILVDLEIKTDRKSPTSSPSSKRCSIIRSAAKSSTLTSTLSP